MTEKFLVSIAFMAYNHERFVAQALESVLNQQCSFPIEIVIGEDSSKDRTREIIREYAQQYPDIIRLLPEAPNKRVLKNWRDVLAACKGKYIAVAHADDFWQDPLKLEKEVSFMESNPAFGLVHTDANYLLDVKDITIENFNVTNQDKIRDGFVFEDLLTSRFFITTCSVCFSSSLLEKIDFNEFIEAGFTYEDLATWLEFSRHTQFKYLPESTCTYRILENSVSRSADPNKKFDFLRAHFKIKKFFITKYHVRKELAEEFERTYHRNKFNLAYKLFHYDEAMHSFNFLKDNRLVNQKTFWKKQALQFPVVYHSIKKLKKIYKPKHHVREV